MTSSATPPSTAADDAGYLAALRADPDDDAVRLVWADALQARGEPRGELIALQLAAARATAAGDLDAAEAAADAAEELLADHEDALTPPALATVASPLAVGFRRGLVEAIRIDATSLAACADELFAALPVVDLDLVRLDDDGARRLAAMPHLAQVRSLTMPQVLRGDGPVATLLASPHLTGLRALRVGFIPPEVVDIVARSAALAGLEHLTAAVLDWTSLIASTALPALRQLSTTNHVHARDIAALTAPHRRERWTALRLGCHRASASLLAAELPALRVLELDGELGRDAARALAAADLPALRTLRLRHADVSVEDLGLMLAAPAVARLETLTLTGAALGHPDAGATLGARALPALRELDLSSTRIDAGVARALATWDLPDLERLILTGTRIGDDGARALAAMRGLGRLRHLDLEDAHVAAAGVRAVAETAELPALRELRLHDVALDEAAARALGEAAGLPRLRTLRLGGRRLDGALATALVDTPLLGRLVDLELSEAKLHDDTLVALAANPDARRLRALRLHHSLGFTPRGLLALAHSPHLLRLRDLDRVWEPGRDAIRALAAAPGLRRVRCLMVRPGGRDRAEQLAMLRSVFGRRLG